MKSIRLNIKGISKVSKERILIEANKILSLSNFFEICKNNELKEILKSYFKNLNTSIDLKIYINSKNY